MSRPQEIVLIGQNYDSPAHERIEHASYRKALEQNHIHHSLHKAKPANYQEFALTNYQEFVLSRQTNW